jgi:hypothetical protein
MQISTIKNKNFEKPFINPSNRTKVNFLKKNFFGISCLCTFKHIIAKACGFHCKFSQHLLLVREDS